MITQRCCMHGICWNVVQFVILKKQTHNCSPIENRQEMNGFISSTTVSKKQKFVFIQWKGKVRGIHVAFFILSTRLKKRKQVQLLVGKVELKKKGRMESPSNPQQKKKSAKCWKKHSKWLKLGKSKFYLRKNISIM